MRNRSKKTVIAALFGNLGIVIFKLVAVLFSGSSSMLAESYHSLSDTLDHVLLPYDLKRSQPKPDECHRFGYGKEQFFWSFIAAMILFRIAGTLSLREGDHKFLHSELISHPGLKAMHFSSEDVLVILEINYQDNLIAAELEKVNDGIERKTKDINLGAEA